MVLLAKIAIAQAPQGIPYQAVARNSTGAILASTSISVRFTIRDSIATGAIKYRETHSVTTTAQGMFSVNVGQGTVVSGTFAGINWGTNAKFMQVEMDPAGGGSYIDMGTQQMMSVPYSFNAGSVKHRVSITGDTLFSGNGNFVIIPGISAANCTLPPVVSSITGFTNVTPGSTTTLSNLTSGGLWSSSNTSVATVGSTGIVTGNTVGTAVISYIISNTCGSSIAMQVITVGSICLNIGDNYGGGRIAYFLQPGDPGYSPGCVHGLIATPTDLGTAQWGCYGAGVSGTYTTFGTGAANTVIVSGACGAGTAARLCEDLVLNGYTDWYLPSVGELQKIFPNRSAVGGFTESGFYWTSSHYNPMVYNAWIVFFGDGSTSYWLKSYNYRVRAVRSF